MNPYYLYQRTDKEPDTGMYLDKPDFPVIISMILEEMIVQLERGDNLYMYTLDNPAKPRVITVSRESAYSPVPVLRVFISDVGEIIKIDDLERVPRINDMWTIMRDSKIAANFYKFWYILLGYIDGMEDMGMLQHLMANVWKETRRP
jgi:hypothetical protein